VSPDLVEDRLQDVFGVISANEPLQVAEYRCAQGGIDLTDRALSIDREPGSEIDAGLFHWRLYRLSLCGTATVAAHNRPSRTINNLLLAWFLRVFMPSALWMLTWTEHGGGQPDLGRPPVPGRDSSLEIPSWQHRELIWRSASGLGGVAVPGPW
jgi:hypothetical protein